MLRGAAGCPLPPCHHGPHRAIIGDTTYEWADDECECCDPDDSEPCFWFGPIATKEVTRVNTQPSQMPISTDDRLNPQLAQQLSSLRGGLIETAEIQVMPERFTASPHPDRPAMILIDTVMGNSATISLFAYREVRKALQDLFQNAR